MPKITEKQRFHLRQAEKHLRLYYGITFADINLTQQEWLERYGDQYYVKAVEAFASQHGLDRADDF